MSGGRNSSPLDFLPAGEWQDVQIIDDARGMMAGRFAVMARATWLRDGGQPAFIKYIVAATGSAGSSTQSLAGEERLERIAERLRAISDAGNNIPIVRLLEVRLIEDTGGLLIAMEAVRPLHDLIVEGRSDVGTAIAVLEALDPPRSPVDWIHYDICPRNVATRTSGEIVLIDVESVYLAPTPASVFNVSVPGWKPFRAPLALVRQVLEAQAASPILPSALARRKHSYEVLLTATECILGTLKPRGNVLARDELHAWAGAREGEPAVKMLLGAIVGAFSPSQSVPNLGDIASALRRMSKGLSAPGLHQEVPAQMSTSTTVLRPLSDLESLAADLRAGALPPERVHQYRDLLLEALKTSGDRLKVWKELLLVAISFEKDARHAKATIEGAIGEFGDDPELQRLHRIILTWYAGQDG